MTNEEALKELKEEVCDLHCHGFDGGCFDDCFAYLAIKALEKQIPKEPKIVRDMDCCPTCGQEDGGCSESWHRPYCCNCGQALDWSDYDY